jgi:hypothetical protein
MKFDKISIHCTFEFCKDRKGGCDGWTFTGKRDQRTGRCRSRITRFQTASREAHLWDMVRAKRCGHICYGTIHGA